MPLSNIVEIRKGLSVNEEKTDHDKWLTSTIFYNNFFFRQFIIKTYDTLILKGGLKRIVYIEKEDKTYVTYRDTTRFNKSLYQMEWSQIDTIKDRAKFGHRIDSYMYKISYPNQQFYVDLSFGIGKGFGANRWSKWSNAGLSLRLSTGYQFKPALGLGISYLSSTYRLGDPELSRLRSFTLDYRVKTKNMAFFTHFGFVSKLSLYGEYVLYDVDKSKSRPTLAFSWAIYTRKRKTIGINFLFSKFTEKTTSYDYQTKVKTTTYSQEFDNNLNIYMGWHFPTLKRYKKIFLRD